MDLLWNKRCFARQALLLMLGMVFISGYCFPAGKVTEKLNPFRVLVIIGDQWNDQAGYLVEMAKPTGEYSGYDASPAVSGDNDFHHLVVLLKSWGIPFDIVRLDQQILDRYMFLDMNNEPMYGTIIWDVNKSGKIAAQDFSIISEMVKDYGIGLVALSDRIAQDRIQALLGLKYKGSWESNAPLQVSRDHFLSEGLASPFLIDSGVVAHLKRPQVEALDGTQVIARQGSFPAVTVKTWDSGGHVVWIGNDHNYLFSFQSLRTILRRSITWTTGYSLSRTWENNLIMVMDDPGGSASSWLEHWHYPELSEEIIEKYLIEPLVRNDAVLNINFVPAVVNDERKRLEPSWTQTYKDAFGTTQDLISAKRGYDKGVKLGVFEVMSHGLTHMQPDLVSDPGWYGSDIQKERSEVGWYREFGDTRRNGEIPAAEQLWRMKTSIIWLKEQFGAEPLEFCPGGLGNSATYINNTARLAGEAGFGWNGWETGYKGHNSKCINISPCH